MMDYLREWILSIAVVALGCSIANVLMPKGRLTAILKICTSLAMAIALIAPLGEVATENYALSMAQYRESMLTYQSLGTDAADRMSRSIIESECAAYILDKGQSLELSIGSVEVLAKWGDGVWYPYEVWLDCLFSQKLTTILETELGVPLERVHWSDENI